MHTHYFARGPWPDGVPLIQRTDLAAGSPLSAAMERMYAALAGGLDAVLVVVEA